MTLIILIDEFTSTFNNATVEEKIMQRIKNSSVVCVHDAHT